MRRLTVGLFIVLASLTACKPEAGASRAGVAYLVDSASAMVIGGDVADPDYQLDLASSAVRLADGRIVVATSGTSDLRVYDQDGKFVRRVGRAGDGPGEFGGPIRVVSTSADSLMVYDAGNRRVSIYGDSAQLARSYETAPGGRYDFHGGDWLIGSFWVRGLRDSTLRGCVAHALASMPAYPRATFTRVLVDPHGSLWLQPAGKEDSAGVWHVHDLEGLPQGSVTLPAGDQLLQLGDDFILTRAIDSIGFESVALYSLERRFEGSEWSSCETGVSPVAPDTAAGAEIDVVGGELRNFTVAQEMTFAMRGGYASSVDSVQWSSKSGHELFIEAATPRSWVAVVPLEAGGFCVSSVGGLTPETWPQGGIKCSLPMPAPDP